MKTFTVYPSLRLEGALIVVDGVGRFYSWSEALAAKFAAGRTITVDIFGAEV